MTSMSHLPVLVHPHYMTNSLETWCREQDRTVWHLSHVAPSIGTIKQSIGIQPYFGHDISKWNRYQTIGDGHCLIHAVFQIISIFYHTLTSDEDKRFVVQTYRLYVMPTLSIFTLEELEEITDPSIYLTDEIARKWIHSLGFNFLLVSEQPALYQDQRYVLGNVMPDKDNVFLINKPYLVLYLINQEIITSSGGHFESVGLLEYEQGRFMEETYGGIDKSWDRIKVTSNTEPLNLFNQRSIHTPSASFLPDYFNGRQKSSGRKRRLRKSVRRSFVKKNLTSR